MLPTWWRWWSTLQNARGRRYWLRLPYSLKRRSDSNFPEAIQAKRSEWLMTMGRSNVHSDRNFSFLAVTQNLHHSATEWIWRKTAQHDFIRLILGGRDAWKGSIFNFALHFAGGEGDDVQGLRLHRLHAVLPLQVARPQGALHPRHQEVLCVHISWHKCTWETERRVHVFKSLSSLKYWLNFWNCTYEGWCTWHKQYLQPRYFFLQPSLIDAPQHWHKYKIQYLNGISG